MDHDIGVNGSDDGRGMNKASSCCVGDYDPCHWIPVVADCALNRLPPARGLRWEL